MNTAEHKYKPKDICYACIKGEVKRVNITYVFIEINGKRKLTTYKCCSIDMDESIEVNEHQIFKTYGKAEDSDILQVQRLANQGELKVMTA